MRFLKARKLTLKGKTTREVLEKVYAVLSANAMRSRGINRVSHKFPVTFDKNILL